MANDLRLGLREQRLSLGPGLLKPRGVNFRKHTGMMLKGLRSVQDISRRDVEVLRRSIRLLRTLRVRMHIIGVSGLIRSEVMCTWVKCAWRAKALLK